VTYTDAEEKRSITLHCLLNQAQSTLQLVGNILPVTRHIS